LRKDQKAAAHLRIANAPVGMQEQHALLFDPAKSIIRPSRHAD
jgi:hypothetical protein